MSDGLEAEEIKEVYARFGLTVYFAQLTEYALMALMVAARLIERGTLSAQRGGLADAAGVAQDAGHPASAT